MPIVKKKQTLSTFKAAFDRETVLENKVRAALASLLKEHGPEAWEEATPFFRRAGVGPSEANGIAEKFKTHVIETPRMGGKSTAKKVWFADARVAAKVRA